MERIPLQDLPVAIDDGGVQLRLRDEDGLTVGFVRLPQGADLREATKGLPDDLCQMHTATGAHDFEAGEAFYWAPGHAPEALEDSEYVDFSPTDEFRPVVEHITGEAPPA